jgi:hypothetical protein
MIKFNDKLSNEAQPTCGNHLLSAAYLMAGKYYFAYNFSLHDIQKIEPMNNLKDRIIINISKGVENNSTKIKIG